MFHHSNFSVWIKKFSSTEFFFAFILLILFLVPQEVVFVLLGLYFIFQLVTRRKLTISMPGWKIYAYFILAGILIGLINLFRSENQLYGLIRHVYYVSLVGLAWYFGQEYVSQKQFDRKAFFSAFIIASSILAVIADVHNLIAILRMGFGTFLSGSARDLRQDLMGGNTMCVLGLYILIFYPKTDKADYINKYRVLLIILYVFAIFSNFSRTAILEVIILALFSGLKKNGKIIGRVIAAAALILLVFYLIAPSVFSSAFGRILRSIREMDFLTNDWSKQNIILNWRGYEAHCELVRFLNSNIVSQLFGDGFGTSLDVGRKYAHLVTSEDTLPFLHNGYFTQLMIYGLVGVFLLVCWFVVLYRGGTSLSSPWDKHFVHGIIVMAAANTYIIHGLLFSREQALVFLLVGSLFALNPNGKQLSFRLDGKIFGFKKRFRKEKKLAQ